MEIAAYFLDGTCYSKNLLTTLGSLTPHASTVRRGLRFIILNQEDLKV